MKIFITPEIIIASSPTLTPSLKAANNKMQQSFILSLLLSATASAAAGQSKAPRASTSAFEGRLFFDFRNLDSPHVPDPIDNFDQAQNAPATHAYFNSAEWTDTWAIMSWDKPVTDKAPVHMTNSLNNVYIQANNDENAESSTFLTLRTVRHEDFQSVAEFDSIRQDYQYVSMKMYARTIGDAGACPAMFTYLLPEGQKVQEADLEILTKDQDNVVHYTNQPGYDPETDTSNPDATRK